jgi:WS/DGAT/MGAT family acyltransferase
VERLTGLDDFFLSMETPTSHMHVAGLAVYDPSEIEGGLTLDRAIETFDARMHLAPPFRRKLAPIPFGLHHPLWVEDGSFNIRNHVRRIAVPSPGGDAELSELVAHLVSVPLDRSRPLWEMWLIEGLEDGRVAILTKVHHAAIDGAAGNQIIVAILDLESEPGPLPPADPPWRPDREPNDVELLAYAANSLARQPLKLFKAARRSVESVVGTRRLPFDRDVAPRSPLTAPRTSLNRSLTAARDYAHTTLSLARVKAVKDAYGVKVNDVVLALCAGALRGYFEGLGEEVEGPLVAMVPVSVRTDDQKGGEGNQVSQMRVSLATDVDEPAERMEAIAAGTVQAKARHAIGADNLQNWAEFAAPAVAGAAARIYSRFNAASLHSPIFNVTISNVPGPPFPLYTAGARLEHNYPVGPIFDGGGLNMTVMSYLDHLDFGLLACPDVVDDVRVIADGLHTALAELEAAAGIEPPPEPASELDEALAIYAEGETRAHLEELEGLLDHDVFADQELLEEPAPDAVPQPLPVFAAIDADPLDDDPVPVGESIDASAFTAVYSTPDSAPRPAPRPPGPEEVVDVDLDAPSGLPPGPSFLGSVDLGRTDPAF